MEFLEKLLLLRDDIASLQKQLDDLQEHSNQQDRALQRLESGSDYLARVIDDMKTDLDLWRK